MSVSDYGSSGSTDPFRTLVEAIDDAISLYASEMVDATHDLTGLALWLSKARTTLKKRGRAVADSSSEVSRQPSTQVHSAKNGTVTSTQSVEHNIDASLNSNGSAEFVMEELDNPFSSVFDDDFVNENGAVGNIPNNVSAASETAQESGDEEEEAGVENDEEWDKSRLNLQRALIKQGGFIELENYVADTHHGSVQPSDEKRRLYDLVQWGNKQRRRKLTGDLDPYQISKLDDLCEKGLWSWEEAPKRPREAPKKAIFGDGVGTIGRVLENASSYSPTPARSTLARSPQLQEAASMKKAAAEAKKASLATKRAAMKAVKEARAQRMVRGTKAVNKEWDQYYNLVKKHMPLNEDGHIWDMPLDFEVEASHGKKIQLGMWLHVQRQELAEYQIESPNWYKKLTALFEQGWSMEPQCDLDVLTSLGSGSGDDEESIPGPTRVTSPPILTQEQLRQHTSSPSQTGQKRRAPSPVAERVQKAPRKDPVPSPRTVKTEPGVTAAVSKLQAIDLCESSDMSSVHSSSSSGSTSSTYSSSTSSSVKSADSQESTGVNSFSLRDKKLFTKSGSAFTSTFTTTSTAMTSTASRAPLVGSASNKQNGGVVLPPRVPDLPHHTSWSSAGKPSASSSSVGAPMPFGSAKPAQSVPPRVDKPHHQDGSVKEPRDPRLKRPDTHHAHTAPPAASSNGSGNGSTPAAPRVASPSNRSTTPTQKQKKVPTHSLLPSDSSGSARVAKTSTRSPSQSPAPAPAPSSVDAPPPTKPVAPVAPVVSPLVDGQLRAEGNYVAVVYSQSSSLEDARFAIAKQLNDSTPDCNEVQVMRLLPEDPSNLFHTRYKYNYNPAKVVTTPVGCLLLPGLRFLVDVRGGEYSLKLTDQSKNDLIFISESYDVHELAYESE